MTVKQYVKGNAVKDRVEDALHPLVRKYTGPGQVRAGE